MKKRAFCFLMTFIMIMSLIPTTAFAATTVDSGICGADGDNLTWTLDSAGVLTINGTGEMANYEPTGKESQPTSTVPWGLMADKITAITIGENITSIGDYAFANCENFEHVTLPTGVTSIGHSAFKGCRSLISVVIPNGVTTIGQSAFSYCTSLKNAAIPDGVTSIGARAFQNCGNLTSVKIGKGITSIDNETFYSCFALESVAIPDGVTSIADGAFDFCDKLRYMAIPASVTSIGEEAFSQCWALEHLYYAGTKTQWSAIDIGADNDALAYPAMHYNSDVIGCGSDGPNITWTLNSAGILKISGKGEMADGSPWCDYVSQIKEVAISNGVTLIGARAFEKCKKLTNVTIPTGVTWIGNEAFSGCSGLESVTISGSVRGVGDYAFKNCSKLTDITMTDNIASIGRAAFSYCSSLSRVTIPGNITSIAKNAFYHCSGLTRVTMTSGVTKVCEGAFAYCSKLKDVYYVGSQTQWGKIVIGSNNSCLKNAAKHYIKLSAPTVKVCNTATGIKVSWNKVTAATSYKLYRKVGAGSWKLLTTTSGTSYTNTKLVNNTEYQYKVKAVSGDGKSATSAVKTIYRLAQPKINSIANTSDGVKITWSKVTGALGYKLYRKTGTGSWTLLTTTTKTSYVNAKLSNGSKLQYKVVALKANSKSAYSAIRTIYRLSSPSLTSNTKNTATQKIVAAWTKNGCATGYQVKYTAGETARTTKISGASNLKVTVSDLTKGSTYKVYVRAYKTVNGTNYYSAWSSYRSVKVVK